MRSAKMAEQLSEDEFHRMQLQILEMRTENYQLKDENKKLARNFTQSSENEAKLEREVAKQTKLRKAFTTLNKSKQAVEFEELLQQNEQAFILQNQTLAEELGKLQNTIKTLENENRQFKRQLSLAPQDKAKDAELRKLQAANAALKQSLSALRERRRETQDAEQEVEVNKDEPQGSADHDTSSEKSHDSSTSKISNKDLIKPARSESDTDLQVQALTLQEEKRLLEFELDNAVKKYEAKAAESADALNALQSKLDQKQKSCNSLQRDINELQTFKKGAVETASKLNEQNEKLKADLEQATTDVASLQKVLQESHTIIEQQQSSLLHWQKQVDLKDEEYKAIKMEHARNSEKLAKSTKELETTLSSLELLQREKDNLQSRYEKTASVGEALLNQYTELERKFEQVDHERKQGKTELEEAKNYQCEIEKLKKELHEVSDLAEKRKKLADGQSVEAQEMVSKLNERMAQMEEAYNSKLKALTENTESQIKTLESTVKSHEEELIRVHHQERVKTREIDGLQQKINDLTAENSSLENSKGWFERALRDAEEQAEKTKAERDQEVEILKQGHATELETARLAVTRKDEEIEACELRVQQAVVEATKKDGKIANLKLEIKDEIQKQKLVEKRVHSTLKDLKKQLNTERKKNELLQEKMTAQSDGKSSVEELLTVVDTSNQSSKPPSGGASSISSFNFRDFISPGRSAGSASMSPTLQRASTNSPSMNSTHLSSNEAADLLSRITELQNDKWALEERVRLLEESGGAMADELLEKSQMVQRYVQHTRTDSVKRNSEPTTPKTLKDKVRSFVTGNDELPQHAAIGNVYELNKKLTRMLEEEMTKNMTLKKDLELMAEQFASR